MSEWLKNPNHLGIGFFGSGQPDLTAVYATEIYTIIDSIFEVIQKNYPQKKMRFINGGYQGTMAFVSRYVKEKASKLRISENVQTYGILYSGYRNDPSNDPINEANPFNDVIITATSIGERVESILTFADVLITLPGKSGTLHEVLSAIEHIKYSKGYDFTNDAKRLLIHDYWKPHLPQQIISAYDELVFYNSNSFSNLFANSLKTNVSIAQAKKAATETKYVSKPVPEDVEDLFFRVNRAIHDDYREDNYILGFDIAISENTSNHKNLILLETFGTEDYATILSEFLSKYESILLKAEKEESEFATLDSMFRDDGGKTVARQNIEPHNSTDPGRRPSSFNIWKQFLEQKQYGQSLLWINTAIILKNENRFNASVFLLLSVDVSQPLREEILLIANEFLTKKMSNSILTELSKRILSHALRSAVSTVFARNYAHNIGAHVKTRATVTKIRERIKQLEIQHLKFDGDPSIRESYVSDWIDTMKDRLDIYEVNRNEFLANYLMPPKNLMLYRDIILPFSENVLLMDNIAASENFVYLKGGRKNRLIIKTRINENEIKARYHELTCVSCDDGVVYPDHYPYLSQSQRALNEGLNSKEIIGTEDIEVCVRSEHAFYSLLENFIRNAAKHNKGWLDDHEKLLIHIDVADNNPSNDFYSVRLYDNVSAVTADELVRLAAKINATIVDEKTGDLRKENLGIADMKINAHLLQSAADITEDNLKLSLNIMVIEYQDGAASKFQDILIEREDLPVLLKDFATVHKDNKDLYRFGYSFKFAKSKKVCWIGKEISNKDLIGYLGRKGIHLFENWELYKAQKNESLAAYQFAVIEPSAIASWSVSTNNHGSIDDLDIRFEEELRGLPFRVLLNVDGGEEVENFLSEFVNNRKSMHRVHSAIDISTKNGGEFSKNCDFEILQSCWENWLTRWLGGNLRKERADCYIYFESRDRKDVWNPKELDNFGHQVKVHFLPDENGKPNIDKSTFVTFYDHHGQGLRNVRIPMDKSGENPDPDFKLTVDNAYFYFDKASNDFSKIFYPPDTLENRKLLLYELIEASLLKVLLVDERIADYAKEGVHSNVESVKNYIKINNESVTHWNVLAAGGVFIAGGVLMNGKTSRINLLSESILDVNLSSTNKEDFVTSTLPNLKNVKYDVLVIHRTYLTEPTILSRIKKYIPFIVVTSGGGPPHGLTGSYKFVPFSLVDASVNKTLSKLSFTQTLMGLRSV